MDAQIAQFVLCGITTAGVIVWFVGLRFLAASARVNKQPPPVRFGVGEPSPDENLVFGTAEVEGRPGELAAKAASVLAKEGAGLLGQMKILERTDDRVRFEGAGASPAAGSPGQCVRRGQIRFSPTATDRTSVDYGVEVSGGRGLLIGGAAFLLAGLIALVAGFWVIQTYVVSSPDPAVRGQAFQMFQVVHFLWPPFLFGGLYRRRFSVVRTGFDTLVHNLPYCGE